MRTYFKDYNMPHANMDDIAPLFRDALLPTEASYLKRHGL